MPPDEKSGRDSCRRTKIGEKLGVIINDNVCDDDGPTDRRFWSKICPSRSFCHFGVISQPGRKRDRAGRFLDVIPRRALQPPSPLSLRFLRAAGQSTPRCPSLSSSSPRTLSWAAPSSASPPSASSCSMGEFSASPGPSRAPSPRATCPPGASPSSAVSSPPVRPRIVRSRHFIPSLLAPPRPERVRSRT